MAGMSMVLCKILHTPLVLLFFLLPAEAIFAQRLSLQLRSTSASSQQLLSSLSTQFTNRDIEVIVLGYHRFETCPKDVFAIRPEVFREQMTSLKENGITVISMKDFLAWRRGEKTIPSKSALITIDDGYTSGYSVAWPILKEFGYPFTLYLYTKYINVGGKSLSWKQLLEMRDAGMEFGSHSVSHDNMVRPRTLHGGDYQSWIASELEESKKTLEFRLNVPISTFAYPYGSHNVNIIQAGLRKGYEAMFTVNPTPVRVNSPSGALGRFIISSAQPSTFNNAIRALHGRKKGKHASDTAMVIAKPANGEVHPFLPAVQTNRGIFGEIKLDSIYLVISGPDAAQAPILTPNYNPKMPTRRPGRKIVHYL